MVSYPVFRLVDALPMHCRHLGRIEGARLADYQQLHENVSSMSQNFFRMDLNSSLRPHETGAGLALSINVIVGFGAWFSDPLVGMALAWEITRRAT